MAGGHGSGLALTLVFAGGGALLLVSLATGAFIRRRSRPYLFVMLALGMLFVRTIVGTLVIAGVVASDPHHFLEHALDLALVGLLLAAVGTARTADSPSMAPISPGDE
ncbi:DUF7471 family protein [Halomarina litorea]|uniref:DUF7471 family protein n=1 Tax=Halomarina litorea TaxID=2961595 RepID=UPI0020C409AB|nr:hypothetical protein [Halomarina sp. BCD28]